MKLNLFNSMCRFNMFYTEVLKSFNMIAEVFAVVLKKNRDE
jgi:hypothetical protein